MPQFHPYYSYLKALIGSVRDAFKAGKKPEMRPKTAQETKEITIHNGLTMNCSALMIAVGEVLTAGTKVQRSQESISIVREITA